MLPKSMNKSLRAGMFANRRETAKWESYIASECRDLLPPAPLMSARITLVRHSHRTLDFDGVVGSMKPVVDSLVRAGILLDDSWKVLGAWNVDQRFRKKKDGPLLSIEIVEMKE